MLPLLLEPVQLKLRISETKAGGINVTWSNELERGALQNFSLTISSRSLQQVIPLNVSSYYFAAPEGAPPCEVYNFSVTASYDIVGATYTGASCSLPSPVLSRMLPSVRDIDQLESSLSYLLMKQPNGGLALEVLLSVSIAAIHSVMGA